jgi:hypothetical protein
MLAYRVLALATALALAVPAAARAQADLLSREAFHGVVDVRAAGGDVERGWVDGGLGKSGLSDGDELTIPRAAITWTPSLGFAVRAHVTLQYEPKASPDLDVNEAYVEFRAPPSSIGRASAKAGVFYPPVSLEHTGAAWTTPDMLSASAINSWIGEEVLVTGVELSLAHDFGDHEVTAAGAVYGWNDTAGTLLSFRGWALQGLTTAVDTEWPLPPLSAFMSYIQPRETYPVRELDHRAGYYGRLEWRPPAPVVLSAIYYDNAGDRIAVDGDGQWSWETRFFNAGLRWEPDERTLVLAQAMNGETLMGYREQGHIWVDVGYRAAYVMARRTFGADALSGRFDWFRTTDRTLQALDDNREHGWAVTASWRHRLADHLDLLVEGQHIDSTRDYRAYSGVDPKQDETLLQTALRVSF